MSRKIKSISVETYRAMCESHMAKYDPALAAYLAARTETEKKYACYKTFRFISHQKKNLPRNQRYPKKLAAFMDLLDEKKIPFIVDCLSSTPSPLAVLRFNGE